MGVLDGLRIIELAGGMSGPMAGMILADNGADVVKVEPPWGDWARDQPGFRMWNRGKRSLVLDLREPSARDKAGELLAQADVVIEGLRPGAAARLGVGHETALALNPRLVYCSITGFGLLGDLGGVKAYEWVVGAKIGQWMWADELLGAAATSGDGVGQQRDWPIYKTVPINSYGAAQLAVQAVCGGLLRRSRTGAGGYFSTSLLQGATALLMRQNLADPDLLSDTGADIVRQGVRLSFLVCECKDGQFIQMCARQEQHFRRWMQVLGLGEVLDEPRYGRLPIGIKSIADLKELEERVRERMLDRTRDEWIDVFIEHDIGADPFLLPGEFLGHPQMVSNGRVVELLDAEAGPVTQPGPLAAMSATPSSVTKSAPRLGEDDRGDFRPAAAPDQPSSAAVAGTLPLAGVTILELAYYVHGPLASALLAELGARVIKVEPVEGDPYRLTGLESALYLHGKESIALDLKTEAGRGILRELIGAADVLFTSFRRGVPERLGFGYETARQLNPRIVYVTASGYGSAGPWAQRAAMHSTPHALSGAGILQAGAGNAPVDDGFPDPVAGLALATAIILGLLARQRTGTGQQIETTMLCSMAYAFSEALVHFEGAPQMRPLDDAQRGRSSVNRLYRCADGWLLVSVVQEREWQALAAAVGHGDWVGPSAAFATRERRERDDDLLASALGEVFAVGGAGDWARRLVAAGVPAVEVDNSSFAQFLYRNGFLDQVSHPVYGDYWRIKPRIDFQREAPWQGAACAVGEHSRSVLAGLGHSGESIEQLIASGVVVAGQGREHQ